MDVGQPISSVVPTLDGPVLAALARSNTPARLSVVHRRAGTGSLSGVRNALRRLVEHGIVLEGAAGYTLNRDHLATPAILALAELHAALAASLRAWLLARPEDVVAAGLFGSAARQDGGPDSDIDVLVVTVEPAGPELRDELSDALRSWTGNDAQVLTLSRDEVQRLHKEDAPIVASWREELIPLLGDRREVVG